MVVSTSGSSGTGGFGPACGRWAGCRSAGGFHRTRAGARASRPWCLQGSAELDGDKTARPMPVGAAEAAGRVLRLRGGATGRTRPAGCGDVFDRVAERYDLMNDLMSLGVHRLWKDGADRLAGAAPGHRPARRRRRHGRHRRAGAASGSTASGRAGHRRRHQPGDARGRPRPGDRRAAGSTRARLASCADAEALPLPDRSFDAVTIAFGIRNVTQIERALAEARRVLRAGRAVPVPRVLEGRAAGAATALRRLLLQSCRTARAPGRRRRRELPLSGREHPPLSRPGDLRRR